MKKKTCAINTPFIPATALLKLAGVEATGGQAAEAILAGEVKVDGNVIHEKRKKIYPGSHVILADQLEIEVVAARDEDHKPEAH
jgi:ribosome-associated protein